MFGRRKESKTEPVNINEGRESKDYLLLRYRDFEVGCGVKIDGISSNYHLYHSVITLIKTIAKNTNESELEVATNILSEFIE